MADGHASAGRETRSQRFGPYQVGETIGRGTFAKVKIALHESTKVRVALKIIPRKIVDANAHSSLKIKREIKIMKVLRHPNIIRLYDVVQTKHDIVLVLEYVSGGELFDYINRKGKLEEAQARAMFQQMAAAVAYCHRCRVTHRDIKPENILLERGSLDLKLGDFGLSSITHDGRFFDTSCGTPNYASPEVVSGLLYGGPETDVWSCGVVLYAMLCGVLPFDDDSVTALFRKIRSADYVMPTHLSPEACDLLRRMLVVDPLKRATMEQVMQHPWMRPEYPPHLLSLHYEAVMRTRQFAKERAALREMLDEELVNVLAARFNLSPQHVAMTISAEEQRMPSMLAVVSDDHPGAPRRYPAALYFESYSNALDSKLWPMPLDIVPAEVALRDEEHNIYVSYLILSEKKQNKLRAEAAAATTHTARSAHASASSFLLSQSAQGYGSINAHSLYQVSGTTSFTGSTLKESLTLLAKTRRMGDKTLNSITLVPPPPDDEESLWAQGYNRIAAPFLPLRSLRGRQTLLGRWLRVSEVPVKLLQALHIELRATPRDATLVQSGTEESSGTGANAPSTTSVAKDAAESTRPASTPRLPPGLGAKSGKPDSLLHPVRRESYEQQATPSLLHPLTRTTSQLTRSEATTGRTTSQTNAAASRLRAEASQDVLYTTESVMHFGNDFMRNGVAFTPSTPPETLRHVYAALLEEGLLWRTMYSYCLACVRYPDVKLQVKMYRVMAHMQVVDVRISAQSGMAAADVAVALLDRLRAKATALHNRAEHSRLVAQRDVLEGGVASIASRGHSMDRVVAP